MIKMKREENEVNLAMELEYVARNPYSYLAIVLLAIAVVVVMQPSWIDHKGRDFILVLFACTAVLPEKIIKGSCK